MIKVMAGLWLAGVLTAVAVPVVVFAGVMGALVGATAPAPMVGAPAVAGIPRPALAAYRSAASACPGLPWSVLAGIGEVESDHGRSPLPGVRSGANAYGAEVICRWAGGGWHVRDGAFGGRASRVSAGWKARLLPGRCHSPSVGSPVMTVRYRAWRAVSPSGGALSWVVVDDDFAFHREACAFLTGLRGADRSPNTERVYAGRVALLLSWCAAEGVDWRAPRLDRLVEFKRWLVADLPVTPAGEHTRRSAATADAVLGTVCEFFRFCSHHGLVDAGLVARLFEPRFLKFLPASFDAGEDGQRRTVRSRLLRYAVAEEPFEFIEPDRVEEVVAAAGNCRDRLLVTVVAMTGVRIGEALGLHREDLHLLADSRMLGCPIAGPHLHVRRRADNPNAALAKSRFPRSIPVPEAVAVLYADYAHERHERLGDLDVSPLVFVNLYRPPLGRPLRYQNVKEMFDRLATATGLAVRPHLLRHTAATTWLRQGTPRDTVQQLLGHASPTSMQPYFHPDEGAKRAAVEAGAEWTRRPR